MSAEDTEHREYSPREIVVIILIVLAVAVVLGNFNGSTTSVQSTSSGLLTISLNATCAGFGEPTYWNSMDPDVNTTTYQYGHCLFGFWVSNGQPFDSGGSGLPAF